MQQNDRSLVTQLPTDLDAALTENTDWVEDPAGSELVRGVFPRHLCLFRYGANVWNRACPGVVSRPDSDCTAAHAFSIGRERAGEGGGRGKGEKTLGMGRGVGRGGTCGGGSDWATGVGW